MVFELHKEPRDEEITSVCPLCQTPLSSVHELGGLVACEPCGCSVYASVAITYLTPQGIFTWRKVV